MFVDHRDVRCPGTPELTGVVVFRRVGIIAVVLLIATLSCHTAQATVSPARVATPPSGPSTDRLDVLLACNGPGSVRMIVRSDGGRLIASVRGRHVEAGSEWHWRVTIRTDTAGSGGSGVRTANEGGRWGSGQLVYNGRSAAVVRATASTPDRPTCHARVRVPRR